MAFLQVITRTFGKRAKLLERNKESLELLTDPDWEQTIVTDEVGRGCPWANANLSTVQATGEYVWVLDDDDVCALPDMIEQIKAVAAAEDRPEVIFCFAYHGDYGFLPNTDNWEKEPIITKCGFSNFFVRADTWEKHRAAFKQFEVYCGDYEIFHYLWQQGARFIWHDALVAWYPKQSRGASEDAS
jgi:hypothetical protein